MPAKKRFVGETSCKQVFHRLAGTWTYWGWKGNYFSSENDAKVYYDEMVYMLANQMAAPNSPQWFNTGLYWAYGIDGPSQGHYYVDHVTNKLVSSALGRWASARARSVCAIFAAQPADFAMLVREGILDIVCNLSQRFKTELILNHNS